MLGFDNVVLGVRVEAVLVELIEVGRVENRHVDIAVTEQVIDERLFAVLGNGPRPAMLLAGVVGHFERTRTSGSAG